MAMFFDNKTLTVIYRGVFSFSHPFHGCLPRKKAIRTMSSSHLDFNTFRYLAGQLRRVEVLRKGAGVFGDFHGADRYDINELSRVDPVEFTRQFFYKNLLKNIIACRLVMRHVSKSAPIFDLGCGAGAFSFAAREVFKPTAFTAIDVNRVALELISEFHVDAGIKVPSLIRANIATDILNISGNIGVSYVLSELNLEQVNCLSNLISSSFGSNFIIIDYSEVILEFLRICASDRPVKVVQFEHLNVSVPRDLVGIVGDGKLSMGVCFVSGGYRTKV